MTSVELEMEIMNKFWSRLCNLSDSDLMVRRQMEMEVGHSLKAINSEMNKRSREE